MLQSPPKESSGFYPCSAWGCSWFFSTLCFTQCTAQIPHSGLHSPTRPGRSGLCVFTASLPSPAPCSPRQLRGPPYSSLYLAGVVLSPEGLSPGHSSSHVCLLGSLTSLVCPWILPLPRSVAAARLVLSSTPLHGTPDGAYPLLFFSLAISTF